MEPDEHRLFCHITRNWQGTPPETYEIVVNPIAATRAEQGLEVHVRLDETHYRKSQTVADSELGEVRIVRHRFHRQWNYTFLPTKN